MTFLGELKDAPRELEEGKHQKLVRPNPGLDEYRVYFNYSIEEIVNEQGTIQIPVAEFVACLSASEPTDQQWAAVLTEHGYTAEKINEILTQ